MEWNLTTTVGLFVALVAAGTGALIVAPIPMGTSTIVMMVAPSMLAFGGVVLFLGTKHGEWRVRSAR
jgi:hypothetical protein